MVLVSGGFSRGDGGGGGGGVAVVLLVVLIHVAFIVWERVREDLFGVLQTCVLAFLVLFLFLFYLSNLFFSFF